MRVINGKQRMCATVIRERELSDVEGHNMATHPYPKHRNTEIQKYRSTEIQRESSDMEGHNIAAHPYPKYRNTEIQKYRENCQTWKDTT